MKTINAKVERFQKATTQEKIDMTLAIAFIAVWFIRALYSPYHY